VDWWSPGAPLRELLAGLRSLDIELPVPVAQSTRVNLEILDARGEVTEILEPAGAINRIRMVDSFSGSCANAFHREFQKKSAHKKDCFLISGACLFGVPGEAYGQLVGLAHSLQIASHLLTQVGLALF